MVHDSDEPLNTPESSFEDSDDLMGYYVALDLFGLTNIFYPYVAEPAQMPLGIISQLLFIQKLQPAVQGCDWRADWHMVYKSSRDGYNRQAYQKCCKDKPNIVVFIKQRGTDNVYGGYSACARKYTVNGKWIRREQDPNMFLFAITGAADCDAAGHAQYTKFNTFTSNLAGYDSKYKAMCIGSTDLTCDMTLDHHVLSTFDSFVQEGWPYVQEGWPYEGIAPKEIIIAEEIEVWQIPAMTSGADISPIIDTTVDPICTLPLPATAASPNSAMTFRNDVSVLRAPVTELSTDLQTWLHSRLRQLDRQVYDIEQQEQVLNKECEFMAYHFPATGTATGTAAGSSKSSIGQLKGVQNGVVHMVLHGDKLCTLQRTFNLFEGNKLANKYGSDRWTASIEADLNSEGYIVEEYDYYSFRKLVNVMRLRALMRSPYCKLSADKKQQYPSQVPATKTGALAWMLAHFMINKEDFYSSFTTADAADGADGGGGSGSGKKRKR
eukprot:5560-Heterococcus_DN1.PRE.4